MAAVLVFQAGCSTIGVRIQPPSRKHPEAASTPGQEQAVGWLRKAGERNIAQGERIRRLVQAARLSLPASGNDMAARTVYNAAVGEVVEGFEC